jgi:hypothetical protein
VCSPSHLWKTVSQIGEKGDLCKGVNSRSAVIVRVGLPNLAKDHVVSSLFVECLSPSRVPEPASGAVSGDGVSDE